MVRLQADPELRRGVKSLGQKPSGFRSHAALPAHDLVDPLYRNPKVLRKGDLRKAKRLKESLLKDLAGMGGNSILG
jgi:hypothetical protein